MYDLYKNGEYFGVSYKDVKMAVYVASQFERVLNVKFEIKLRRE